MKRPAATIAAVAAITAGAILLLWPALLNGYPILFSDTHTFLIQGDEPRMVWDKPFIYGPFLLLHAHLSLWLPTFAQGLLLSHLLWLTAGAAGPWSAPRHLALSTILAATSTAPWFAALLMPDIFAGMTALCLFVVVRHPNKGARVWAAVLGMFCVAAHASDLAIALNCAALLALVLGWRAALRASVPPAWGVALLLLTNLLGAGVAAISPYGPVFLLARLVADGPARPTITQNCPQSGWHVCAWANKLPTDSDDFLWSGDGPVWTMPGGPLALAPEATTILARTFEAAPLPVAHAMVDNTLRELTRTHLGDTLSPTWLDQTVVHSLHDYLPPAETLRYRASRQAHDTLAPVASRLNPWLSAMTMLGTIASILLLRHPTRPRGTLAALALTATLANAFATGALSGVHDRYQARITWVLVVPGALGVLRKARPGPQPLDPVKGEALKTPYLRKQSDE